VGNFVGNEALAAVGSTFILNYLLVSLFSGLGLGFSIVIARFYGAKDTDRIKRTVDTSYIAALVGAVPVTIVGILAVGPLLTLMNSPAGLTRDLSASYLTILFIGTIGSFGYNLNAGILQGLGDSVSSLVFLAIATVLNIALDLVFVLVFHWGVPGVAWATIISQFVSFFLGTVFIVRKLKLSTLRPSELRFDAAILGEAARIGLPNGIQNTLFSLGTMAIQRLINGYGPIFMAGYSIEGKIDSFAFMPIASFATAITTYTGQNIGAGRLDRVRAGFRSVQLMSGAVCVVISVGVLLGARSLLGLFTSDAAVVEVGCGVLYRLMPCYLLLSVLFITNSMLRGAGESFWPFFASFSSFMLTRLPAAYLLDWLFGKEEIGWCYGIGWVFGLAVALGYYATGRWKARISPKNLKISNQ
jgi:putative MATE family efflux protein